MMKFLTRFADVTKDESFSARMRRKRFSLFLDLLDRVPNRPLRILDIGGTERFWEVMGFVDTEHQITLLNNSFEDYDEGFADHRNISSVVGDARFLNEFKEGSFDIVFSNSVIEHVGTLKDQAQMANEIRRLCDRYYVQTPDFFFPLEPHYLFPFFHWLPISVRVFLLRNFSLGWAPKAPNLETAKEWAICIRLLKKSELQALFPDAVIYHERFLGLTKSFVIIKS